MVVVRVLDNPRVQHVVQLYSDDAALARNVADYLATGLHGGRSGLVIATVPHWMAFKAQIELRGVDCAESEQSGRLLHLDAERVLARVSVNGRPDWDRFYAVISGAQGHLDCQGGICAYGEMVGLLWARAQFSAAVQLEEYWNRILARLGASLFCAYPIDVFGPEFEAHGIHAILADHTCLLPSIECETFGDFLQVALHEVTGMTADDAPGDTSALEKEWGAVPNAELAILRLRRASPQCANEVLRLARQRYQERLEHGH